MTSLFGVTRAGDQNSVPKGGTCWVGRLRSTMVLQRLQEAPLPVGVNLV